MGGSFSERDALPSPAYWRRVATSCEVAATGCLLLIAAAGAVPIRRARQRTS